MSVDVRRVPLRTNTPAYWAPYQADPLESLGIGEHLEVDAEMTCILRIYTHIPIPHLMVDDDLPVLLFPFV